MKRRVGVRQHRRKGREVRKHTRNIKFKPPKAAQKSAQRFLRWKKEHGNQNCHITRVGLTRARQLASGKPLGETAIRKMYRFKRHKGNERISKGKKPWQDCGRRAWEAWGGDAGINWAEKKVRNYGMAWDVKKAKKRGGKITHMSPDEFLKKAGVFQGTKEQQINTLGPYQDTQKKVPQPIAFLSKKIKSKQSFVPAPSADASGYKGRHRALAAKLAKEQTMPVILYET